VESSGEDVGDASAAAAGVPVDTVEGLVGALVVAGARYPLAL
jgi:hypothetical protein